MDQEKTLNEKAPQQAGQLKIADDVVAMIAGLAISVQEGIEKTTKKNKSKGVSIQMEDGLVVCNVELSMMYGAKIPELAAAVQQKIKTAVENMTGLGVKAVNVNIVSMNMEKANQEA